MPSDTHREEQELSGCTCRVWIEDGIPPYEVPVDRCEPDPNCPVCRSKFMNSEQEGGDADDGGRISKFRPLDVTEPRSDSMKDKILTELRWNGTILPGPIYLSASEKQWLLDHLSAVAPGPSDHHLWPPGSNEFDVWLQGDVLPSEIQDEIVEYWMSIRRALGHPLEAPGPSDVMERFRADIERLARCVHVDGLAGMVEWRKNPEWSEATDPFFDIFDTYRDAIAEIERLRKALERIRDMGGMCQDPDDEGEPCPYCIATETLKPE